MDKVISKLKDGSLIGFDYKSKRSCELLLKNRKKGKTISLGFYDSREKAARIAIKEMLVSYLPSTKESEIEELMNDKHINIDFDVQGDWTENPYINGVF